MLRTLDRYIIRETLAPFGLTLLILTFLLQIPTIMDVAEKLIAKGVTLPIIGRIVLTLLPSSLAITIPRAAAADRENPCRPRSSSIRPSP